MPTNEITALLSSDSAQVTFEAGTLTVGRIGEYQPMTGSSTNFCYRDWWDWYPSYPTVYRTVVEKPAPDTFKQAFQVVSKLMEDGYIKELKVSEFTKLVEKIAKQLETNA